MRTTSRILVSHALAATAMGMAWPLLLAAVWESSSSPLWLGLAGACRMAPYVLCSWWVGQLADRHSRSMIVRLTLGLRVLLLAGSALAWWADALGAAVLLSALAVAVSTPAYPALVAGLPKVEGARARTTEWLVTIEVCSFVVGPAIGGLLMGAAAAVFPAAVIGTAAAYVLMRGVHLPAPVRAVPNAAGGALADVGVGVGWMPVLQSSRQVRRTLALLAAINFVLAAVGIALLPMATGDWSRPWSTEMAFGVGTAVLGFGALGAPLLARLGRGSVRRTVYGLVLMAVGVLLVGVLPTLVAALPLLVVLGAAAVHAEGNATRHLQDLIPDESRASVFGVGDTLMVGAALAGALSAPIVVALLGSRLLLVALSVLTVAVSGLILRPTTLLAEGSATAGRPASARTLA